MDGHSQLPYKEKDLIQCVCFVNSPSLAPTPLPVGRLLHRDHEGWPPPPVILVLDKIKPSPNGPTLILLLPLYPPRIDPAAASPPLYAEEPSSSLALQRFSSFGLLSRLMVVVMTTPPPNGFASAESSCGGESDEAAEARRSEQCCRTRACAAGEGGAHPGPVSLE